MITNINDPKIWQKLYAELKDEKHGYIWYTSVACPVCNSAETGYTHSFLLCHDCESVVGISFTFPYSEVEESD